MIIDTEHGVATVFVLGERNVIPVLGNKRRQEARTLLGRHQDVEQHAGQDRSPRQHGCDIGIADGQLFGHDAAGQVVGAGAACVLREHERAQADARSLLERLHQERPRARLQPVGVQRQGFDLLRDEIADRLADLQLLRAEVKAVHSLHSPLMPALLITPAHLSRSLRMRSPS